MGRLGASSRGIHSAINAETGTSKLNSYYLDEVVGPTNNLLRVALGCENIERIPKFCLCFAPYLCSKKKKKKKKRTTLTQCTCTANECNWADRTARVDECFELTSLHSCWIVSSASLTSQVPPHFIDIMAVRNDLKPKKSDKWVKRDVLFRVWLDASRFDDALFWTVPSACLCVSVYSRGCVFR